MAELASVSEVVIRVAAPADAAAILHCLSRAFAPYQLDYTHAAFADTVLDHDRLKARMQQMRVLVAGSAGEIVGTVAGALLGNGEGHLRSMAVVPEARGSGIAARLLRAIEDWLRDQGCTRISLDTTLPLRPAMKFYERHGYKQSGRVTNFFGMPLVEYIKDIG